MSAATATRGASGRIRRELTRATNASAFVCGILFAVGLGLAGMTDPRKVLAFLDVTGDWDPSLALVMIAAIAVHAPLRRLATHRPRALLGCGFSAPSQTRVDWRLLTGAALFGAGWGMAGYCPGPALTSLATGAPEVIVFAVAMAAGMKAYHLVDLRCGLANTDRSARQSDPQLGDQAAAISASPPAAMEATS